MGSTKTELGGTSAGGLILIRKLACGRYQMFASCSTKQAVHLQPQGEASTFPEQVHRKWRGSIAPLVYRQRAGQQVVRSRVQPMCL
jgi:hypothetical protein